MSIKPVDFQMMMPRTTELSKTVNDEQHKNNALQQQQAAAIQNKADMNTRQVHTQENVQQGGIREKQEKEQGGGRGRGKKQEDQNSGENKDKKKRTDPQVRTSTIDIRL